VGICARRGVHAVAIASSVPTNKNNFVERVMPHLLQKFAAIVGVLATCAACAPEIVRSTIPFVQKTDSRETIQLTRSATIPNYSGTGTQVFIGTRWDYVGDVSYGKVYRSKDTVFFLRGANTHEAYLVIKDNKLLGFYLPGDKAWSPLEPALDIAFTVN
jgi:hypothetical protein